MGLLSVVTHKSAAAKAAAGPVSYVADVSEFQPDLADAAYLKWSKAVIIRAMYGSAHDDKAWYGGARRDLLHQGGALFTGIYQYVVAGQSAVVQAHALLDLIGPLQPGEKLIADIEEGAGSQAGRWQAWAAVIKAATGDQPWCYSDLDFAQAHGLTPEWVAAYQKNEPAGAHLLWQFTNAYEVPGIGSCDCSLFRGSVEELAALAYQPAVKPSAPKTLVSQVPADWRQILTLLPVLKLGDKDDKEPWMVRRVQGIIGALGPDCKVTGVFDEATETAVKGFQANHGIPATGIVDAATWSMLIFARAL